MSYESIDIVLSAADRLVPEDGSSEKLRSLPVAKKNKTADGWCWIRMPDWASDLVPAGLDGFYVPMQDGAPTWREYDWWLGAAALLTSVAEKKHEAEQGTAHSYFFRLHPDHGPAVDYAWVNRIVMFLRRWWAHENESVEEPAFGKIPRAVIYLTHDVDAVSKTLAIRGKQAAFNCYNKRFGSALRFLFGPADYWQFETITDLEHRYGRRSVWNFYGARGGVWRTPKEHLFDPAYDVLSDRLVHKLRWLHGEGHIVGLHPRFDTWQDPERMRLEKETIEEATGHEVTVVRQHWLRFSFAKTWKAQMAAGLRHDFTLGFNDRFGFRNSAALTFKDDESGMRVTPMVLMDSHLFDYSQISIDAQRDTIDHLLDELVFTGGEASIIWHHRVFHADYGWGPLYEYLLQAMQKRDIASPER